MQNDQSSSHRPPHVHLIGPSSTMKSAINERIFPRRGPVRLAIMNKEAQLSIAECDFILNALREGVRLDGRQPDELRPLNVSFGDEYGHVKVQLGKTRYVDFVPVGLIANWYSLIVRISSEVTKPRDDRPFDGPFTIAMELTSMGSPAWSDGRYVYQWS